MTNLNSFVFYRIDTPIVIHTSYSSALSNNSPTYARLLCKASTHYYESIQVEVVGNGHYSFLIASNVKTNVRIYKDNFNPSSSDDNLHSAAPVSCPGNQLKLLADLQADTTYVLVVSTDSPTGTTDFSIIVSGPSKSSLIQLSEYFYCFANN
jgi:hypothetical protein